jgi:hypothetical protein
MLRLGGREDMFCWEKVKVRLGSAVMWIVAWGGWMLDVSKGRAYLDGIYSNRQFRVFVVVRHFGLDGTVSGCSVCRRRNGNIPCLGG